MIADRKVRRPAESVLNDAEWNAFAANLKTTDLYHELTVADEPPAT